MKSRASGFGNVGRREVLKAVAAGLTMPVLAGAASAAVHVTWWDFLSGGDGIVMKAML
ncbi:MAG: hypothetical protein JO122_20730, partial [Acetobacteraceae bacterium]|nr:hypothetical protein [Acetobacteraceae bacterium]